MLHGCITAPKKPKLMKMSNGFFLGEKQAVRGKDRNGTEHDKHDVGAGQSDGESGSRSYDAEPDIVLDKEDCRKNQGAQYGVWDVAQNLLNGARQFTAFQKGQRDGARQVSHGRHTENHPPKPIVHYVFTPFEEMISMMMAEASVENRMAQPVDSQPVK